MKSRKQHKSLCFILILSMLFLGMCFEEVEADSFFAYQLAAQSDSVLRSNLNTSFSKQVYTEEALGRPVGSIVQVSARRNHSKTGNETDISLSTAEHLLRTIPVTSTFVSSYYGALPQTSSMIVDYIHQKDGKKAS